MNLGGRKSHASNSRRIADIAVTVAFWIIAVAGLIGFFSVAPYVIELAFDYFWYAVYSIFDGLGWTDESDTYLDRYRTIETSIDDPRMIGLGVGVLLLMVVGAIGVVNESRSTGAENRMSVLDEVRAALESLQDCMESGSEPHDLANAKVAFNTALERAHAKKLLITAMPRDIMNSLSELNQLDEAIRIQSDAEREKRSKRHTIRYFLLGIAATLGLMIFAGWIPTIPRP